jgi:CheY-like chemotaxis protein
MRRSLVLGETYDEAAGVVDHMVRLGTEVGSDKLVLCLDQHMDYDEGSLCGTDVCAALRTRHAFDGVIVVLSANDDDEAKAEYHAAGVDASIGKGRVVKGKSLAETLVAVVAKAYAARVTNRAWGNTVRTPAVS